MLPFDKAKSLHTHKFSQYANEYEASEKSDTPGLSKKILSVVRNLLPKVSGSPKVPRVA